MRNSMRSLEPAAPSQAWRKVISASCRGGLPCAGGSLDGPTAAAAQSWHAMVARLPVREAACRLLGGRAPGGCCEALLPAWVALAASVLPSQVSAFPRWEGYGNCTQLLLLMSSLQRLLRQPQVFS